MSYERENIRLAPGYVPGEQIDGTNIIKLNTNENPYPPAPSIGAALREFDAARLRTYPPPNAAAFRKIAGQVHGLAPEQVIATNGGDELLRLAIATFAAPGEVIGLCSPSYSLYEVLAEVHGAATLDIPLADSWAITTDTVSRWNAAHARLAFIVNPQAPSGYLINAATIATLAEEFQGVLMIDEAYVDFVDPAVKHDIPALLAQHDNLLILRTLSKGYSLAGLRFGYGLGSAPVIDPMQLKTKDSYNTDAISQVLACAALQDQTYARDTWSKVREHREVLRTALAALDFPTEPSETNFVLARVPEQCDAKSIYESLREREILVRYFSTPRLQDKLRITVGTAAQNDLLLSALSEITGRGR